MISLVGVSAVSSVNASDTENDKKDIQLMPLATCHEIGGIGGLKTREDLLLHPNRGLEYCEFVIGSVCWSVQMDRSRIRDRSLPNFLHMSPVAPAQSSSGGVAICYILSVLWMTLCLP